MPFKIKKTKRHYPQAYYRYNEKKPGIFIRLSKEIKNELDNYRGKMSYGEAVERLLDGVKASDKAEEGEEEKKYREDINKIDAAIQEEKLRDIDKFLKEHPRSVKTGEFTSDS